jgi:hypothetical protein
MHRIDPITSALAEMGRQVGWLVVIVAGVLVVARLGLEALPKPGSNYLGGNRPLIQDSTAREPALLQAALDTEAPN